MQTIKNERLTKTIQSSLGNVYDLLKEEKAFLAGGAITSLFCNREINDWDIYFRSKWSAGRVALDAYEDNEFLSSHELLFNSLTGKSLMCTSTETQASIQLITFQYFKDVASLFNTFDFTVCMGAYDFETETFILHPDFMMHNSQRFLKYNPKTAYPMISALRVQKYVDKGYTISKLEMMRILATISQIKIDSWGDAEEHLGGMYAQTITQLEEANGEFSMDALLEALGKELYRDSVLQQLPTSVDLREVMKHLSIPDLEEHIDKQHAEKEEKYGKYYYKRIGQDFKSTNNPRNVLPIEYKEGEIVNGGRNGIYCRKWDRIEQVATEYKGPFFVVMEKADEVCYWNGASLIGDVRVLKIVPWSGCEALEYRQMYKSDILNMLEAEDEANVSL